MIFFWANIFAGISALLASRLASRFGLIKTMVATHLPSNILLILVPLMPTLPLAVLVLLVRFSISQMDVPTRQSYLMAVVSPEERSAAAGITGVARTIGAAISPLFVGLMFARPALINLPFFIAGTLKIAYDLLLYQAFVAVQPPEEMKFTIVSAMSSPLQHPRFDLQSPRKIEVALEAPPARRAPDRRDPAFVDTYTARHSARR